MKHLRTRQLKSSAQALFLWLLFLPFLTAQLLAPGTMPRFGTDGLQVVLCTTDGLQTVTIDADGTPTPDDGEDIAEMPVCPWASGGDKLATLLPSNGITAYETLGVDNPIVYDTHVKNALKTILPPARAPPVPV